MAPRPRRPAAELDASLDRGDLGFAMNLAEELRVDGKRMPLETASRFLPLVAKGSSRRVRRVGLRWLGQQISGSGSATVEQATEVGALLADLPFDPAAAAELTAATVRG